MCDEDRGVEHAIEFAKAPGSTSPVFEEGDRLLAVSLVDLSDCDGSERVCNCGANLCRRHYLEAPHLGHIGGE